MNFKRRDFLERRAPKLSGSGFLSYSVWHDEVGREYVKIEANIGGGPDNGTFSDHLYALNEIRLGQAIVGYEINTGNRIEIKNTNMPAFLRAIKAHYEAESASRSEASGAATED